MIYRLIRKFVFLNFHFPRFCEHFRHLREKYKLKWKIKYTVIFRISCPTRWYIICLINLKFKVFVFAILRTFSLITQEIYVEMTNKAHNFNLLIVPVLMMCIYISFIELFVRYKRTTRKSGKPDKPTNQHPENKSKWKLRDLLFLFFMLCFLSCFGGLITLRYNWTAKAR